MQFSGRGAESTCNLHRLGVLFIFGKSAAGHLDLTSSWVPPRRGYIERGSEGLPASIRPSCQRKDAHPWGAGDRGLGETPPYLTLAQWGKPGEPSEPCRAQAVWIR